MSTRTLFLNENIYQYLLTNSLNEIPVLKQLRDVTHPLPGHGMQISPEQGQLMTLLMRLMQAKNTLEIGVYTGYSTLCVALALPENGKIIACDISDEYTKIATQFWQQAGVIDKIDLRIAPAKETLQQLIDAHKINYFDFAFIDADKGGYETYYEQCLQLIRPGGLIMFDNVLWKGAVADQHDQDKNTVAIRKLNAKLANDPRVSISMLPIGDGITLALKH